MEHILNILNMSNICPSKIIWTVYTYIYNFKNRSILNISNGTPITIYIYIYPLVI